MMVCLAWVHFTCMLNTSGLQDILRTPQTNSMQCRALMSGCGATRSKHLLCHDGCHAAASAAAEAARLDAEGELLGDDLAVELDEFGRNTNLEQKRELDQRAKKRRKLLAVSQAQMHLVAAGDPFDAHDKDEADAADLEEVSSC